MVIFALFTVNVCAVEVPPPGVGLKTVILNAPAAVKSDAKMEAVSVVELVTVVDRALLANCKTVAPLTKPVPVADIVNPGSPTVADTGKILVNVGMR